jgi:hypothetical protein
MNHTTITDANARIDLIPGQMISYTDARGRTIEIESDQFDDVYRVCIKHDPEDRTLWYHFDFEQEHRLDQFLINKGFAGLKRSEAERLM